MKYYGATDKGRVRKNNQDSYVIATNKVGDVFAIVADGIGGNLGGDIASQMAVADFSGAFSETEYFNDAQEIKQWIGEQVSKTNERIYTYGQTHDGMKGMGTTLCGVIMTSVGKFVVNIGDSRAYAWFDDGRFIQLTMDHTLVNDMVMHGQLTHEEAMNYPKKNVLTNALGVWQTVRCDIDIHTEKMQGMLLCSDGLHGYVTEKAIKSIILDKDSDPSLRPRRLLKAAMDAGGFDNVTIVLIDLEGDGLV